jgi:hypothetical protein
VHAFSVARGFWEAWLEAGAACPGSVFFRSRARGDAKPAEKQKTCCEIKIFSLS